MSSAYAGPGLSSTPRADRAHVALKSVEFGECARSTQAVLRSSSLQKAAAVPALLEIRRAPPFDGGGPQRPDEGEASGRAGAQVKRVARAGLRAC